MISPLVRRVEGRIEGFIAWTFSLSSVLLSFCLAILLIGAETGELLTLAGAYFVGVGIFALIVIVYTFVCLQATRTETIRFLNRIGWLFVFFALVQIVIYGETASTFAGILCLAGGAWGIAAFWFRREAEAVAADLLVRGVGAMLRRRSG